MNVLAAHEIPEIFIDIEANNNVERFNTFKASVEHMRTDARQYISAYQGMVFMSQTVESKHLFQFKLKNVQVLQHSSVSRLVSRLETAPNFQQAIRDGTIVAVNIAPLGGQQSEIEGRIQNFDDNYIYIKVIEGFESLSIQSRNRWQFFDLNFHINQIPYQLQLQALNFVVEHGLFDVFINNSLYWKISEQQSSTTEYPLR